MWSTSSIVFICRLAKAIRELSAVDVWPYRCWGLQTPSVGWGGGGGISSLSNFQTNKVGARLFLCPNLAGFYYNWTTPRCPVPSPLSSSPLQRCLPATFFIAPCSLIVSKWLWRQREGSYYRRDANIGMICSVIGRRAHFLLIFYHQCASIGYGSLHQLSEYFRLARK